MNIILQKWNEFWFSPFNPLCVSVFRIFLGVEMFIFYIANFPNWERFYAADGIISLTNGEALRMSWWSIFSHTEGFIPIKIFWLVGLLSTILFTLGWKTRLATILLYIIQTSMNCRDWYVVNGEDHIFRMLLFYSCFAPLNYCLSIDSFLKEKKLKKLGLNLVTELPSIWPIRAMQINIALIYLVNIPNKLTDDFAWLNGEAIYWSMANSFWGGRLNPLWFAAYDSLLSKFASYGTLIIEGLFPYLVWFKRTKMFCVVSLALLHLGIAFMIPNVTFFTLSMVCAFWVFVPPSVILKRWNSPFASINRIHFLSKARTI